MISYMSYMVNEDLEMTGSMLFGNSSPAIRYSPSEKLGAAAVVGFKNQVTVTMQQFG